MPSLTLSILPLRDLVVFPHMVTSLFVGRDKSIRALEKSITANEKILLVAQKQSDEEYPTLENIHAVGTIATLLQIIKLPDGTLRILAEGKQRCKIKRFNQLDDYITADVEPIDEVAVNVKDVQTLCNAIIAQFELYVKLNTKLSTEALTAIVGIEDAGHLADVIATHLLLKLVEHQTLLSIFSITERLEKLLSYLDIEIDFLQINHRLRARVKQQMDKNQRDYYLNEQLKAIQKELVDADVGEVNDLEKLKEKIKQADMSKEAFKNSMAELNRLKSMSPTSSEANVARSYLEWMINVPWKKHSPLNPNLKQAEKLLDAEHYGLEKVKERILEYLAVTQRVQSLKGEVLCLVGPPGVGKTSLGQSIAKAIGREFVRFSLGGVRDEAEIRGHRRTYVGAIPGRIIQKMTQAKVNNPLFLLDEIDKMSIDFRGDPSAALLEVLDPEQNNTFNDHYLDVDYDLSKVMFIATANSLDIPAPLLDRMELIHLSGYTEDEKINIAKRHLIPKQVNANGLKKGELAVTKTAVRDIIRYYTREAGVRNLERELAKLCRKIVRASLSYKTKELPSYTINQCNLTKFLGVPRYRFGLAEKRNQVGQVTGLAWTEAGGDLLTIEVVTVPGKGEVKRTGNLASVMLESIDAAVTMVRARAAVLGIDVEFYKNVDIHFHVPEGAIKKDGPSAGVSMCVALVSSLTQIPIRADVAMTGEITLRGEVLPIGGLKEKLLAALRGGIKVVIIPQKNQHELSEISEKIKKNLDIRLVGWIDELFALALETLPQAKGYPAALMHKKYLKEDKLLAH